MAEFDRRFPFEARTPALLGENAWFCDLLSRWLPPGETTEGHSIGGESEHLRLAIRNGYLNFYRAGQSVARVCFKRGKLRAEIHNKYIHTPGTGQQYVALTSAGYEDPVTGERVPYSSGQLQKWISNANVYSGKEKYFVDLLLSRNPDVIDLEMGLPAYLKALEDRRAPRMDLVSLEPAGKLWRIVFWEAKLVGDPRVRSRNEPEVLNQFLKYTRWLAQEGHEHRVIQAYQCNCRLLVALHAIARQHQPGIPKLGAGICAVAADGAPLPLIDKEPRLLVDARYDHHRYDSFVNNGHLKKLKDRGLYVQVVRDATQMVLENRYCP